MNNFNSVPVLDFAEDKSQQTSHQNHIIKYNFRFLKLILKYKYDDLKWFISYIPKNFYSNGEKLVSYFFTNKTKRIEKCEFDITCQEQIIGTYNVFLNSGKNSIVDIHNYSNLYKLKLDFLIKNRDLIESTNDATYEWINPITKIAYQYTLYTEEDNYIPSGFVLIYNKLKIQILSFVP